MKIERGGKNPYYLMLLFINIWASTVDRQESLCLCTYLTLFTHEVQKDVLIL